MSGVGVEDVRSAAAALTGEIEQLPPMVSAVQVGGRRLHELARAGIEVERAARMVRVSRFDVLAGVDTERGGQQVYRFEVDCGSGTYVRSLVADLGTSLGGGAHLRALRRVAVGPFDLSSAHGLDELSVDSLLPPADALPWLTRVVIADELSTVVGHGRVLPLDVLVGPSGDPDGPWVLVDAEGRLRAIYERREEKVKPAVVFSVESPAKPA
jgi:tRNA pseudouridine55 synthase